MKNLFCILNILLTGAVFAFHAHAAEKSVSLGGKIWNVSTKNFDEAIMWGPVATVRVKEDLWVSGMVLQGSFDGEGIDENGAFRTEFTRRDGELVAGRNFELVDLGAGFRYSTFTTVTKSADPESVLEVQHIFGPMIYVGTGSSIGNLPIAWYAGGSIMFLDLWFGDDGEHYNYEGGLSYLSGTVIVTVGYRRKEYFSLDTENATEKGVAASVSVRL